MVLYCLFEAGGRRPRSLLILLLFTLFKADMSGGYTVQSLMKDYLNVRDNIFEREKVRFNHLLRIWSKCDNVQDDHLGSDVSLDWDELQANNQLMKWKSKELEEALVSGDFGPARSFYLSKSDIEASKVFAFLRAMPKGAALHTHHISLGSIKWIVANLTYW